jgi:tetratricopeptide (TPR) repeat protein
VETELPVVEKLGFPRGWGVRQELSPGLYCVSATALQGVADRPRGRWCRTFERDYQAAAAWLMRHESAPDAPQADASARQLLAAITRDRDELGVLSLGTPPSDGALAVAAFNILQAGRLKAFLRHRPPDAVVGGSILVFRLDAAEIDRALHGTPAEFDEQSWFERERYGTADELVRQGRRHLDGNRLEEALAVFRSATTFYPGDPRGWDGLAIASRELGDAEQAARAEQRCERLRARPSRHHLQWARSAHDVNRAFRRGGGRRALQGMAAGIWHSPHNAHPCAAHLRHCRQLEWPLIGRMYLSCDASGRPQLRYFPCEFLRSAS